VCSPASRANRSSPLCAVSDLRTAASILSINAAKTAAAQPRRNHEVLQNSDISIIPHQLPMNRRPEHRTPLKRRRPEAAPLLKPPPPSRRACRRPCAEQRKINAITAAMMPISIAPPSVQAMNRRSCRRCRPENPAEYGAQYAADDKDQTKPMTRIVLRSTPRAGGALLFGGGSGSPSMT